MANPVCEVLLTEKELEPSGDMPGSVGAVLDFWGIVRVEEEAREIHGLEYEAHTAMAEHQLLKIGQEVVEQFKLSRVVIRHRVGFIPAGKASLFVRMAAPHRAETIRAMEWLVDELKKKVPIWKRPRFKLDQRQETATEMEAISHR